MYKTVQNYDWRGRETDTDIAHHPFSRDWHIYVKARVITHRKMSMRFHRWRYRVTLRLLRWVARFGALNLTIEELQEWWQ